MNHLDFEFPRDRKKIGKLSVIQKQEWYAHQFEKSRSLMRIPIELSTYDFMDFWKWNYYFPLRIKRFFMRLLNLEMFKRYPDMVEMKKRVRDHSI